MSTEENKKSRIFTPRVAFKPFEYPDAMGFVDAINHAYWLVSEFTFEADKQDFYVNLDDVSREAIKRALLAISQIEVSVKKFWGKHSDKFPKAEFDAVGATFAESEVRHARAYSHLLDVLNLNSDFDLVLQNPVIKGRVDYLTKYLKNASSSADENYTFTLTLFSMFIENVSLFSQFAIIRSFNRHYNGMMKSVDNVIQATMKEEELHALYGAYLINIIRSENPDWFNEEFEAKLHRACKKAYEAECNIIDWIFETGELEYMSKDTIKEYIKKRINYSMEMIGVPPVYEIDADVLRPIKWFDDEAKATVAFDFFNKKSVNYTKRDKAFTADDLF